MEPFEAMLREHDIAIVGQVATGSGQMLRLRLRSFDGIELEAAFAAETLVQRPEEALREVAAMFEQRRRAQNGGSTR